MPACQYITGIPLLIKDGAWNVVLQITEPLVNPANVWAATSMKVTVQYCLNGKGVGNAGLALDASSTLG